MEGGGERKKKTSLRRAESPDSHVVYCRLTKGWEVRTVTSGNMNEVPPRCSGCTGKDSKASRRGRGGTKRRGEEGKQRERNISREEDKAHADETGRQRHTSLAVSQC